LFVIWLSAGDGRLSESELEQVMKECLDENGIELPESDLHALVGAIVEEARATRSLFYPKNIIFLN